MNKGLRNIVQWISDIGKRWVDIIIVLNQNICVMLATYMLYLLSCNKRCPVFKLEAIMSHTLKSQYC